MYIHQCDQRLNKTETLKPSVIDGLPNSFHLPNFPHMAWVNRGICVFRHFPMVPQYSVMVSIMKFHPSTGNRIPISAMKTKHANHYTTTPCTYVPTYLLRTWYSGVVVSMFDFHRNNRGSTPDGCGEIP